MEALTSLEKLNAVANDSEAGTEETGLDTVEEDNGGNSKLFNLKTQPFCRMSETVYVCHK